MGQITERVYNKYQSLLKEQGPSPTFFTEYAYDLLQRPIKKTHVYNDGLQLTTRTFYDLSNHPIKEIGIYGQVTAKTYNEQKLLKSVTAPPIRIGINEWATPTTERTYDMFGHVATETSPTGARISYQHNPEGKVLSILYPDGARELFCYNIFGDLLEKTDLNASKTYYTYDSQARVLSELTYDASCILLKSHTYTYEGSLLAAEQEGDLLTTYTYDHAERIIAKNRGDELTEYSYDSLGRQVENRIYYGYGPSDYISSQKTYDLLNRVIEEREADASGNIFTQTNFVYDERGNIIQTTSKNHAGLAVTKKSYDPRGNLCAETDALGNTTHYIHRYDYVFEGQTLPCIETIDPIGVKTVTVFDYEGRVVSECKYSSFGALISKVEMIYNLAGNLVKKEDHLPDQIVSSLREYDIFQRLIRQTNGAETPEQLVTTFSYNSNGELIRTDYADGSIKHREYDGLGRLSTEYADDGSIHYGYSYDMQSNPVKVVNAITGKATIRHYSPEKHLLSEQLENGLTIHHTYDRTGRSLSFTYPDGSSIIKSYNPLFLTKTKRIVENKVAYNALYSNFDLSGTPNTVQFPKNSGTLTLEYDLLTRPISIRYPHHQENSILYDERGYLVSKIVNGEAQTFAHDDLGQLTLEKTATHTQTFENDALHRQVAVDGIMQMHNAVNQLIHGDYVFDLKGRRIQDGGTQFAYDKFDRLIDVHKNGNTWNFTYDAFNRKMSRSFNGETCYYIYDGNEEIGSYDLEGQVIDRKILSDGEGSLPIAAEFRQQICAPILSPQGHIIGLVDIESGDLVDESPVTAFGKDLNPTALSPWRFCGKRHEDALGIIDFGFRYYHPKSAQWLTQDPIGECDGPNLYAYVCNNPTRCIDRFGLFLDDFEFNYSWKDFKQDFGSGLELAADYTYRSPRFMGGVQAVGGFGEVCIGAFSAGATGGLAAAPGALAMIHGTDHFVTGCRQMCSGNYQDTQTARTLEAAGISRETALAIDNTASMIGVMWCSKAVMTTHTVYERLSNSFAKSGVNALSDLNCEMPCVQKMNLSMKAVENGTKQGMSKISGYTYHGLNQAIGRNDGRGVALKAILQAVQNPVKVKYQTQGVIKYMGSDASVVVNSQGKIITVFGKSRGPQIWNESGVIQPK